MSDVSEAITLIITCIPLSIIIAGILISVPIGIAYVVNDDDIGNSTDLVEDSSDDGKRIIFVNDDMDDAPAGWEWVIEKNDEGNDILILRPIS